MSHRLRPTEMDRATFIATFGHVFEHSPWIVEATYDRGLPANADAAEGLHGALCAVLRGAPAERQRALIDAHPDLAGRLARAGQLTSDSTREQAGAGLDRLSEQDYARFVALNEAYKARFGFPFIMAVKGRGKEKISGPSNVACSTTRQRSSPRHWSRLASSRSPCRSRHC
jgi:2-oxo-4-hydroxy-4-carboxy-5-ureidoimidazoline decarboxylase